MSSEFTLATEVQVKATPSLLYNNLCMASEGRLVYVSKGEVCIGSPSAAQCSRVLLPEENGMPALVYNVRCPTPKTCVAVTSSNLHVVDLASSTITESVPLPVKGSTAVVAHVRGSTNTHHHVGYGNGAVSVLPSGQTEVLHKDPVTDIAVSGEFGASCDAGGTVCAWSSSTLKPRWAIDNPNGDCCTSVCITSNGFVAAAFGSGHVRLFNAENGALCLEIGAHGRWVNGMTYSATKNELVTASEDMLLCSWKIPAGPHDTSDAAVSLRAWKHLKDSLLTGVALSEDENYVGCSVFDQDRISVFKF
eukprot:PhM_4_TR9473/c2_g2_i1/m.2172